MVLSVLGFFDRHWFVLVLCSPLLFFINLFGVAAKAKYTGNRHFGKKRYVYKPLIPAPRIKDPRWHWVIWRIYKWFLWWWRPSRF